MRKISKKRRFHEQVHITDLLFSLGLLCLFTISSLTVLLIGAHVYKQTALDMKTNYTTRTALTYVAEKVRQHDSGHLQSPLELLKMLLPLNFLNPLAAFLTLLIFMKMKMP